MKTTIGKTKIEVEVRGCCKCGVQCHSEWKVSSFIPVKIGNKEGIIFIHICGDCLKYDAPLLNRMEVGCA